MPKCSCIATCGKRKIWSVDPSAPKYVPANDAYVGPLSRKTIVRPEVPLWELYDPVC